MVGDGAYPFYIVLFVPKNRGISVNRRFSRFALLEWIFVRRGYATVSECTKLCEPRDGNRRYRGANDRAVGTQAVASFDTRFTKM